MTEKEKCKLGLLYDANYDKELINERKISKELCYEFNSLKPSEKEKGKVIIKKLFGKTQEEFSINQPFYCDYGYNIEIGENFYSNHNLIILDGAKVKIGNNVFIGPNCCITTAGHPIDVEDRNFGLEYAYPITIGNNVWIGTNVSILPGVKIGENSIIGAGSVVNRDIPENVIVAGNPCKIIRKISEKDKEKYKR